MKKFLAIILTITMLLSVIVVAHAEEEANLALSATASATASHPALKAININDGNDTTRWAAYEDGNLPLSIQLTWESDVVFDTLVMLQDIDRTGEFTVFVADDNGEFKEVCQGDTTGKQETTVRLSKHYTTKKLKITFTSVAGNAEKGTPWVYELEVYKKVVGENGNIAGFATPSASVTHPSLKTASLNDGDKNTRWGAYDDGTLPLYAQLSWESPAVFDTVVLTHDTRHTSEFTLLASDKDGNFSAIYQGNTEGKYETTVKLPKHCTTKDLRVTYTSVNGSTAKGSPWVYEIEVFCVIDEDDDNLARFASASASATHSALKKTSINDGDRNTRWAAYNETPLPVWAQLNWTAPISFDTVTLYEGYDYTGDFKLFISDDGIEFTEIYSGHGIGAEGRTIELSRSYTAKHLRVTFLSLNDGYSAGQCIPWIYEFEVYSRLYNPETNATIQSFTAEGIEGIVDDIACTVVLPLDDNMDLSSITPVIKVAEGATYSPQGPQDFTIPVVYTITAKDGKTTRQYEVAFKEIEMLTDSDLIDKGSADVEAYGPTPTISQYKYQRQELAAFLHFSMGTYNGNEWSDGTDPVSTFSLTEKIDADEYVKTIKAAGFKKIIVTAKHHDGFCIWDSKYTEYDIASTNYPGDVLADISAACTKYGMEMGLYISPWDRNAESYGYYDEDGNPTDAEHDYLDYNEYYVNQLEEILSNPIYGCNGHFTEIWLDGAKGSGTDAQEYDFVSFVKTMNKYEGKQASFEDDVLLFGTSYANVRWIGNEVGIANEENWSKANGIYNVDTGLTATQMGASVEYGGTSCAMGVKEGNFWVVPEVDARINSTWFWHENTKTPKTLKELRDMFLSSVGHNSVLLLNVPLNQQGKLDEEMKDRVLEWGQNIQASFYDNNLICGQGVTISATEVKNGDLKFKPSNVADENDNTYWAAEKGTKTASLYVNFGKNVTFDALTLEEDIRFGQRIENFAIYYKNSEGKWTEFSSGSTIGGKRVVLEKPVIAKEIKITFVGMTDSAGNVAEPVISHVGVYKATDAMVLGSAAPEGIDEYDSADANVFVSEDFTVGTHKDAIGGSYLEGQTGDSLTINFSGSYAWLVAEKNSEETILSISVDGKTAERVTVVSKDTEMLSRIWNTGDLLDGNHTITVTVVSGIAKIDGIYVLSNGEKGMLDFESATYTVDEDMFFDVKVVRKGGSKGSLKAILQDNPGSAVQSSYYTTSGIALDFAEGETEKVVTLRTKRYTLQTGTLSFTLELVSGDENTIVTGFNDPCKVNITDAESYGEYLKSIAISSLPNKLSYYVGDKPDLTGLVVVGNYATGYTGALLPDQYEIDTEVVDRTGDILVTISTVFDEKTAQFAIKGYSIGDANQDGNVNVMDLVAIQKGIAADPDADRDGDVDADDTALIRRKILGGSKN